MRSVHCYDLRWDSIGKYTILPYGPARLYKILEIHHKEGTTDLVVENHIVRGQTTYILYWDDSAPLDLYTGKEVTKQFPNMIRSNGIKVFCHLEANP